MIKTISNQRFGITVSDLKEAVKDWPETDNRGNPYEVWIRDSNGYAVQAVEIGPYSPYTLTIEEPHIIISTLY